MVPEDRVALLDPAVLLGRVALLGRWVQWPRRPQRLLRLRRRQEGLLDLVDLLDPERLYRL